MIETVSFYTVFDCQGNSVRRIGARHVRFSTNAATNLRTPVDVAYYQTHLCRMSLISQANKAPIPFEPELGHEAAAAFADAPDNIAALLVGVAGCSAYLRNLMRAEGDWLAEVFASDPNEVIADILALPKAGSATLSKDLRRGKRRLALYTALADCGGMWSLEQVTHALTVYADHAVERTLNALLTAEFSRGRLVGCVESDLDSACGMVVLAMGKMGAFELNYSSDIDLIVLFDETRHRPENFDAIREQFIRITKRMARLLSDMTADGYVFRTDLRLRPDPSVTPVCISMAAAERYYESVGRTWERAAFIKARPCAGDTAAGWGFIKTLRPFVWRKHLDYAAIQDAHDMRLRIRAHKRLGGQITLPGHNMKLGRGGIREIEFFTQTRQIIAGGRDVDLRVRETVQGLQVLAQKDWISNEVATALSGAYIEHRLIEHRIQMLADAQTHDIPMSEAQICRLANFCGYKDATLFGRDITQRLEMVHNLTELFFAQQADEGADSQDSQLKFSSATLEMMEVWPRYPALRSSRGGQIFNRLKPLILSRVAATADPDLTMQQFDGFLAGLPAGVQLFSLFEANPQLIDLLVDICGSAPNLAHYLSRNSAVFDGVIGGTFFEPLPDADTLSAGLEYRLGSMPDYEMQLNEARRWMKEQHFRIGVQHLKGMINSDEAGRNYADLATSVLRGVLPAVTAEFSQRHGPMPGRGAVVLGMGSLGAGSLTATSDLDLIVIYDATGQEASAGKRPLAVSTYFARLTQALVTALSSPMADGRLYEVDMRLRPSGRKGPVATALPGFISYQQNEAWSWEHLALTRARVVAGTPELAAEVEAVRRMIVTRPRDPAALLQDVRDMRARLADATDKAEVAHVWEAKQGPGRMLDIELVAQTAALLAGSDTREVLAQLDAGLGIGWIERTQVEALKTTYLGLRRVQQISRLLVKDRLVPANLGAGGCAMLAGENANQSLEQLELGLIKANNTAIGMIDTVFSRLPT
ncbi:MAG: glutamate-ammonia-ligase adenylyltransferase [Paracoccaceae bacterium]